MLRRQARSGAAIEDHRRKSRFPPRSPQRDGDFSAGVFCRMKSRTRPALSRSAPSPRFPSLTLPDSRQIPPVSLSIANLASGRDILSSQRTRVDCVDLEEGESRAQFARHLSRIELDALNIVRPAALVRTARVGKLREAALPRRTDWAWSPAPRPAHYFNGIGRSPISLRSLAH